MTPQPALVILSRSLDVPLAELSRINDRPVYLAVGQGVDQGDLKAAEETGLPEGLPVITGAGDQPCGTLGAGVIHPGEIAINGGTSCTNEFVVEGIAH
jgi:sugar (pentulose or hexulose) kinase